MLLPFLLLQIVPLLLVAGDQGRQRKETEPLLDPLSQTNKPASMILAEGPPELPAAKLNGEENATDIIEAAGSSSTTLAPFLEQNLQSSGDIHISDNTTCNSDITDSLSRSAEEACDATSNIDKYITQMRTFSPMELSTFSEESYKGILKDYNVDLVKAQRNYDTWREGDSVFSAIKETFDAAKDFEPSYNTEFEQTKKRIAAINKANIREIKDMEERINKLQGGITELEIIIPDASDPEAREFLMKSLEEKAYELEQLQNNAERIKTEQELNELIAFLESVAHSVGGIQSKAFAAEVRVEELQENIIRDSSIFLRHHKVATSELQRLELQIKIKNQERRELHNVKERLEVKIRQHEDEIYRYQDLISNTDIELSELEYAISRKQEEAREKKIKGAALLAIPIFGWIAGGILLAESIEEEKRLAEHKRNVRNERRRLIDKQLEELNNINFDFLDVESRIRASDAQFQKLGEELNYFKELIKDFDKIQKDIASIVPSVNTALLSTAKAKEVFDGLRLNLDDIIEVARAGKANGIDKNLSYFIYSKISDLKCTWNQASTRIVTLGECA